MRKISLEEIIDKAFSAADDTLIEIKSAMLGLCTDIDRYFKVVFGINLNEKIDETSFKSILEIFPIFSSLTTEQFNRFVLLFVNIRTVSAHLYCSKPIFLDEDLKEFIKQKSEPTYIIEKKRKITVYGAVLVLVMMAQKYMIWPFCTSFFRNNFLKEIKNKGKTESSQITAQKKFNILCGLGKPITQNAEAIHDSDSTFINDVLKRSLTHIFFDLEKILNKNGVCSAKAPSLASLLKTNSLFDENVIAKIIKLRNCWYHGYFIGDIVKNNEDCFEFTLKFTGDVLKEISEIAKKDENKFTHISDDINKFSMSFFNYYVLRLVEISYKILDKRLLTKDKLESRLENMGSSFKRFEQIDPSFFEMLAGLLNKNEIKWSVASAKFLDKLLRKFNCENLKIAKLHSENGFKIGDFKTERKDIVLVIVDIEQKFENLVNGHYLRDMQNSVEKEYSRFITVVNIKF